MKKKLTNNLLPPIPWNEVMARQEWAILDGEVRALRDVIHDLLYRAGEAFANDRDVAAIELRKVANMLKERTEMYEKLKEEAHKKAFVNTH